MARHCSRSGCTHEAVATLSFQYARSTAWIDDLTEVREPHCYDLCENHARRTTPPSGWRLEDRRHRYQSDADRGRDDLVVSRAGTVVADDEDFSGGFSGGFFDEDDRQSSHRLAG